MTSASLLGILRILSCVVVLAGLPAGAAEPDANPSNPPPGIFDSSGLHQVQIHLSRQAWQAMQPTHPGRGFGRRGLGHQLGRIFNLQPETEKPPEPPPGADVRRRSPSYFGAEYDYVRGTIQFDDHTWRDVGIRFKGNSSYNTVQGSLKRPFKIDFNRFVDGQEFHGLQQINLHNNACDPSQVREALSYWVFRQAGIPAPRTTFALVYLTVDGLHDRTCLGAYTLVEEVDKRFLKSRFGTKKGLLVKPEDGSLPYLGTDWARYRYGFQPRTDGTDAETRQLIELTRIIHREEGAAFRQQIAQVMDVDEFLHYVAINALIANLDSLLAIDHNFYLYVPPGQRRIIWLPWDLNLTWGAYQRHGGWDELMELSIDKPWVDEKPILDKVFADPEWRRAYHQYLSRLTSTSLAPEKVQAEIAAMEAAVREADRRAGGAIASGNPPHFPWSPPWKKPPSPALFAAGRWASVLNQLAGRPTAPGYAAYVPRNRTGGVQSRRMQMPADRAIAARAFAALDADGSGKLDEKELVSGITAWLFAGHEAASALSADDLRARLEPFVAHRPEGRRTFWGVNRSSGPAGLILFDADRDMDGKVARSELRATIRRLLYENDANDDGQLDLKEFSSDSGRFPGMRR